MSGRRRFVVAGLLVLAVAATACATGGVKSASTTNPTPSTGKVADVPGLGAGVTATQIKVGVALVDLTCIPAKYAPAIYVHPEQAYNAFIDNINEHGGINGRKIVPVYKTVCPIPENLSLAVCTSLTEDDHVFAVIGSMYDPDGAARLCMAKEHKTVVISDGGPVTQEMIGKAPPGLFLTPGITSDRQLKVVMSLVKSRHILDGKTVGVLTESPSAPIVKSVVEPALRSMRVHMGEEAVLSISGLDTTTPLAQLDSFIERWKTQHVNELLILVGGAASSLDFVAKVKKAIPGMELIADTTSGQEDAEAEVMHHVVPNPYDGLITAEGRIHLEHSQTAHFRYCRDIFEHQTGIKVPLPNVVVKLPNGRQNDIYGNMEDVCSFVTMFQDVAERVGKNLNDANWTTTVNNFGSVKVMNTDWASIHAGKYDADDTYGLVAFDPTVPPKGDRRHVTPTEDVAGT